MLISPRGFFSFAVLAHVNGEPDASTKRPNEDRVLIVAGSAVLLLFWRSRRLQIDRRSRKDGFVFQGLVRVFA
jgi:hypothetical protein